MVAGFHQSGHGCYPEPRKTRRVDGPEHRPHGPSDRYCGPLRPDPAGSDPATVTTTNQDVVSRPGFVARTRPPHPARDPNPVAPRAGCLAVKTHTFPGEMCQIVCSAHQFRDSGGQYANPPQLPGTRPVPGFGPTQRYPALTRISPGTYPDATRTVLGRPGRSSTGGRRSRRCRPPRPVRPIP